MTRQGLGDAISRGMNMLTGLSSALAVILLGLIFVVLIGELMSRNFLGYSFAGSWELAAFMMAAMFYLGLSPALKSETHVRVRMLPALLSPGVTRLLEAAVLIIAILVTGFAALALIELALTSLSRSSKSWELAMPLAIPQGAVALGMVLFCLSFLARFLLLLLGHDQAGGGGE
ncbi:MAG: TRAP transporter small permease [Pseudorhodobacter sp.]